MTTSSPDKYTIYTSANPDIYKKKFELYHEALAYAISLTTKPKIKKLLIRKGKENDNRIYNIYCIDPDEVEGGAGKLTFCYSTDDDINELVGGQWYFTGGW